MSMELRLVALAQAIGADIKAVNGKIGDLSSLPTTAKNSIVASLIEMYGLISGAGVAIDDNAGTGDTSVTWSANKSVEAIASAIEALRDDLIDGAGPAFDTFKELQDALGDDPNFATTIATAMGNRVRVDAVQTFTTAQKLQGCENIGVGNPERDFVSDYTTAKT